MFSNNGTAAVLEVSPTPENLIENGINEQDDNTSKFSPTDEDLNQYTISVQNFHLLAEDEQQISEDGDIKVVVDSPQRHKETFETYVSYKVTAKSTRPEFGESEYVVRRRYNDFLWLRNKLVESYPTRIIPPLPSKHTLWGHLDRYAKSFILLRMTMLHRFLNRVVKHPILSFSEYLKIFLTANLTELANHQKMNGGGLFTRVSGGIYSMTLMHTTKEKSAEFDDVKKYITSFSEKFNSLEKIFCRMYKERQDLTREMNQLSLDFEKWANSERTLSPLLLSVSQAFSSISSTHDASLANPLEYVAIQPIREYLLYVDSIKEALARRDTVQIQYESSVEEVHRKKVLQNNGTGEAERKFLNWKTTTSEDQNDNDDDSYPKIVSAAEVNHDNLQIANEDFKSDLERWSLEKQEDCKRILLALSNNYIQYYQKSLNVWEETLKKVNVPLKNDA